MAAKGQETVSRDTIMGSGECRFTVVDQASVYRSHSSLQLFMYIHWVKLHPYV